MNDHAPLRQRPLLRGLFRAPIVFYRCGCGWMLGHRFLLLIHIGRRTGRRRETVLEVLEYRPQTREAVVLSGFGRHADWVRNIQANPSPTVLIGAQRFVATWRMLDAEEALAVFARYERRNRFVRPIIRGVRSGLLGWTYDGTDATRRRFAAQLPFIAFRPSDDGAR